VTTSTVTRTRGDDWTIPGTIEADGAPVNLTGCTLASKLRETAESTTATATFTVTVTDATAGEVTLSLARATTVNIGPRDAYVYDIEVITAADKKTTYGVGSKLVVKGDATK